MQKRKEEERKDQRIHEQEERKHMKYLKQHPEISEQPTSPGGGRRHVRGESNLIDGFRASRRDSQKKVLDSFKQNLQQRYRTNLTLFNLLIDLSYFLLITVYCDWR